MKGFGPALAKVWKTKNLPELLTLKRKYPLRTWNFTKSWPRKRRLDSKSPPPAAPTVKEKPAIPAESQPKPAVQQSVKDSKKQTQSKDRFTVQLASFKDLNSAKKFAARFKDLKPQPTIRTVDLSGTGRWYRVQVGKLSSRDEATALADRLAKKYQLKAFVITLDG